MIRQSMYTITAPPKSATRCVIQCPALLTNLGEGRYTVFSISGLQDAFLYKTLLYPPWCVLLRFASAYLYISISQNHAATLTTSVFDRFQARASETRRELRRGAGLRDILGVNLPQFSSRSSLQFPLYNDTNREEINRSGEPGGRRPEQDYHEARRHVVNEERPMSRHQLSGEEIINNQKSTEDLPILRPTYSRANPSLRPMLGTSYRGLHTSVKIPSYYPTVCVPLAGTPARSLSCPTIRSLWPQKA